MITRPGIRVLHAIGTMERGGAETWLMNVLRNIDRDRFAMDFLVQTENECAYDDEIRALGGNIIRCLEPQKPHVYARNFRNVIQHNEKYDIIHSHCHHYSGFVLRLARKCGIPVRIAHSHNDTSVAENQRSLPRKCYTRVMRGCIHKYASAGLAVSEVAAIDLFGRNWRSDPRWRLFSLGLDFGEFHQTVNRDAIRDELGIPREAFVIGHVGRFYEQKNHMFLVDVANALIKQKPDVWLLLAGDGPLRQSIEQAVDRSGIEGRVTFAGVRSDVSRLMLGAMDVFVFPSIHEGLGLVLVEAQAAGLPCVISSVIPPEACIVGPLISRLSLDESCETWAKAILDLSVIQNRPSKNEALGVVEQSPLNIQRSIKDLERYYCGLCSPR